MYSQIQKPSNAAYLEHRIQLSIAFRVGTSAIVKSMKELIFATLIYAIYDPRAFKASIALRMFSHTYIYIQI